MRTRTWPFGTTKQVEITEVVTKPTVCGIICVEHETNEAFVLIQHSDPGIEKGSMATIIFAEGGARQLTVRPLAMFEEHIENPEKGYSGPRFYLIQSNQDGPKP